MKSSYWVSRRQFRYYKIVKQLIDELGPGELIVDVGNGGTPVATYGTFRKRIAVDIDDFESAPNVRGIRANWLTLRLPKMATVVTCLQVLEHLPNRTIKPFADKLLASGRHVIVSVPYCWKKGTCDDHLQDPIDEAKLYRIMGRHPLESMIVTERPNKIRTRRLIAVYEGGGVEGEDRFDGRIFDPLW